jgi:NADH-quinone oxidoreductase subunit A
VAQYLGIFVMLVLSTLFALVSWGMSRFAASQRPTAAKEAPFECGIVPAFEPVERFPVRFYLVAMIFIIFDIEVVFLYPWAVIFHQLGRFGLVEMLVFALAVVVAFAYLVSNGALEWGPAKRLRRVESPLVRTTASTVRKVPSSERAA